MKTCVVCGKPLPTNYARYCSKACKKKRTAQRQKERYARVKASYGDYTEATDRTIVQCLEGRKKRNGEWSRKPMTVAETAKTMGRDVAELWRRIRLLKSRGEYDRIKNQESISEIPRRCERRLA